LAAVGVTLTDNVDPYEQVKLRMLNASHMMLAFPGLLAGYRIAHEAMADQSVHRLLNDFMELDAAPQLASIVPAGLSLDQYRKDVLSRFGNPAIGDQLLRIASDGASKILVFMQDTLRTAIAQDRELRRVAFFLACFLKYFGGKDDNGSDFPVVEPYMTPATIAQAVQPSVAALQLPMFAGWGLSESPKFSALFAHYRTAIDAKGVKQVMADLLAETTR
jgi:mannitol 2-dehydrogenase